MTYDVFVKRVQDHVSHSLLRDVLDSTPGLALVRGSEHISSHVSIKNHLVGLYKQNRYHADDLVAGHPKGTDSLLAVLKNRLYR